MRPSGGTLALAAAALLAGCAMPDSRAPAGAAGAETACRELPQRATLAATTLSTRYVPAGTRHAGNQPAGLPLGGHCVVTGRIDARTGVDGKPYATGFELSLPDGWNGRLLYLGGGGNDGTLRDTSMSSSISLATPSPLGQGYAVVSTDAGHQGSSAEFGLDPRARVDHAFDAHHKTALAARALVQQRYGRAPDHAYFSGCSGGGRQGMMFAQRYPELFDGITAGAPAMRVASGATVAAMWNSQRLLEIAPKDASGAPILSRAFSPADLDVVAKGVLQACDAADGVVDGMVQAFPQCRFDPAVLQCPPGQALGCLSALQVSALKAIFAGPKNSAGRALYAGQPWDPGIVGPNWRMWVLGSSTTPQPDSRYVFLMVDALKHEFFTPPDPGFDWRRFDVDRDPARMMWFSALYDTYEDTRLAAFRARGGKMLFVHGVSDPIFSALELREYYDALAANHGGVDRAQGFARAFFVPGMNHCSGGPATDQFDSIQAMVDWVEKGQAPERIVARALPSNAWFPNRTRPLCPYPATARYRGNGSVEDAASFECVRP